MKTVPDSLMSLSISEIWRRIEQGLETLSPTLAARLAPPATAEEIVLLESELAITLPQEYKASLREHAGFEMATNASGEPYTRMVVSDFILFSPEVVLSQRRWLSDHYQTTSNSHARVVGPIRAEQHYMTHWIPVVAEDEDRSVYNCLDMMPAQGGSEGQVVSFCTNDPDRHVAWVGFKAMLAGSLLHRLETQETDPEILEDEGVISFLG